MSRCTLVAAFLLTLQALAAPPKAPSEEVNGLSLLSGARAVSEEGTITGLAPQMHDGELTTQYDPNLTQNPPITIELAEPFDLTRLEVINSHDEANYPGISVKQLRVEHGPGPGGPWKPLADWALEKGTKPQSKPVSATKARYLRVTLVSNHGNDTWVGLSELRAWGKRSTPREVRFTGAWYTSYGEMRLTQTGQRITGCYGTSELKAGNKVVEGTLEGPVFFGIWRETQDGGGSEGTIAFTNQKLSEKRADSVKKWLTGKGIPAKQLKAQGLGMSRPTMPNDSEAGRAANRRVEVVRAEE
jgi:hypothetical protein